MSDKFSFRGGDPEGVPDGDYVLTVAGGHVTGLTPAPTSGGGTGIVESIVAGANITVDSTDPANPVVSATSGGSGSAAQSYLGTATAGGSVVAMVKKRAYLKKVTLSASALLTNIEAYLDGAGLSGPTDKLGVGLWADNAGSPGLLLSLSVTDTGAVVLDNNPASGSADGPPRWFGMPLGRWCTPGSYWIGVLLGDDPTSTGTRIYYTPSSGSDRTLTPTGDFIGDAGFWGSVATTDDYSIRANAITL